MAAMGHEERFAPPGLYAGYAFRKATFAGMRRNAQDAPKAVATAAVEGQTNSMRTTQC